MSSKTWRLFLNYGMLSAFLILLILQPMIHINNSQTFSQLSAEKSPSQIDSSLPQDQSSTDYTELPFFRNSTSLISWFETSLQDNASLPESPTDPFYPFYFTSTDRSGTSVLDDNHYLEDIAVYLKGCADLLGINNSQKVAYLTQLSDLGFKNSTEKGYYTSVNGDWSQNSTVKEVGSNAQLILSLIDLISDPQVGSQIQTLIPTLWLAISSLFYDIQNISFNHSISDPEKYMEDQFIAAISAFLFRRAVSTTSSSNAKTLASNIMTKMIDGTLLIYRYDSFDFKRGVTLAEDLAADHNRDLSTNAWGIWALLEWFVSDSMPASDATNKRLEKAEKVFRALNRTLWNNSASLFMTKTNQDGSTILDSQMSLKDNAIMLMATKRLFEVTGNFTYYNACMKLYSGIERNFRDTLYGNYYFSVNGTSGEINTQKNFKAHVYLIQSYSMMESLAKKSTVSLTFNSTNITNIILGQASFLNISAKYEVSYQITLPAPSSPKSMNVQVQGANFYYVIRDPEGEVINIHDMIGGASGKADYYYPIPLNSTFGSYSVAIRVNFTGLETKFVQKSFTISSGVSIKSHELITSPIYPSSRLSFNITVNNTRLVDLNASVKVTGLDIVNETFTNQSFTFSNLTTRTYRVNVTSDAIFGSRSIIVDILKDDVIYATTTIPITIASSLLIENIQYDRITFRNTTFEININTRNLISENQSLSFKVSGVYINGSESFFDISASSTLQIVIPLQVISNALYGDTSFVVNITRAIDGNVVEIKILDLTIKPLIEFVNIVIPTQLDQGKQNYLRCLLINNKNYIQSVLVYLNEEGSTGLEFLLQPGLNEISIPIGSKFYGPYAYGAKSFPLTIYDNTKALLIYEELIVLKLKSTVGTILLGYVLPVIIPCVGVVIMKHLSTENKKRLGV